MNIFQAGDTAGRTAKLQFISVLVILAIVLLMGVAAPTSAHVNSAVNGCSGPITPDGIFHNDCDLHDTCYDARSTPNTDAGRLRCDNQFLAGMQETCTIYYPKNPRVCNAVARTYYLAVRKFGGPYFQNPNKN
jgi:Prokaryotic phospholipase A2